MFLRVTYLFTNLRYRVFPHSSSRALAHRTQYGMITCLSFSWSKHLTRVQSLRTPLCQGCGSYRRYASRTCSFERVTIPIRNNGNIDLEHVLL